MGLALLQTAGASRNWVGTAPLSASGSDLPDHSSPPPCPSRIGLQVGPNLYAYVKQNPWTSFDPHGLESFMMGSPWDNRYNMSNPQYAAGFNKGAGEAARVAAPILVGGAVAIGTGGAVAPLLGAGGLGLGSTATAVGSSAIGAFAGDIAAQGTEVLTAGRKAWDKTRTASATALGGALGYLGSKIGESISAFKEGFSSVKPTAPTSSAAAAAAETQAVVKEETMTLYRGVPADHDVPAIYEAATKGKAVPRGGNSTPEQHNRGLTDSDFTSWTTNDAVARTYGANGGPGGVLMTKTVPKSEIVQSPNNYREAEVLLKGTVHSDSHELLK